MFDFSIIKPGTVEGVSLNLASSLIYTALGAFMAQIIRRGLRKYRFSKLQMAFGRDIESHRDVAISLPLWTAIAGDRSIDRFYKIESNGDSKTPFYGPDKLLCLNDALSAAHVTNLFGDFFSKPIVYTNDSESITGLTEEHRAWKNLSVILVGAPIANFHSRVIYKGIEKQKFKTKFPMFEEIEENEQTKSRLKIVIKDRNLEYYSNIYEDYGVVVRLKNPFSTEKNRYIFIIAGIHAESTQEAGWMLRENWNIFCLAEEESGFVFIMNKGVEKTGKIILNFGIPKTFFGKLKLIALTFFKK